MKTRTVLFMLIVAIIAGNSVIAQDQTIEKVETLKKNLRKYFVSAPRPGFIQKAKMFRIAKKHMPAIRKESRAFRSIIIEARKNFREELTREQLLKTLEMRDQFCMRRPGVKMALLLEKLEPSERNQLLQLLRNVWRSEKNDLEMNLDQLMQFIKNNIRPKFTEQLELSADQQIKIDEIAAKAHGEIKKVLVSTIKKVFDMRQELRETMTSEQRAYIEANRDKIFQEILNFANEL